MDKKRIILPLCSKYHKKGKLVAFKVHHIVGISKCCNNVNHCILLMYNGNEYEIMQPPYTVAMYISRYKN